MTAQGLISGVLGDLSHSLHEKTFKLKRILAARIRGRIIEEIRKSFGVAVRLEFPYGQLFRSTDNRDRTFFITQDAGLFSCLTTFMWSVMDMYRMGQLCIAIDNSLGMNHFKSDPSESTWYELFERRTPGEIQTIMALKPMTEYDLEAASQCRRGLTWWPTYRMFDHHGDYLEEVFNHIGVDWARAFVNAYLSPTPAVLEISEDFLRECRIASTPTIAVYYRGTDKYTEVPTSALSNYFQEIDKLLENEPYLEILVQTDQQQVLDTFSQRYKNRTKHIKGLPLTTGNQAIHIDSSLCGNRNVFAQKMYAMCLALAKSQVLITNTGNVGFFLALHSILNGNRVIQIR